MRKVRRGRASNAIFSIAVGARYHYRPHDQIAPKTRRVKVEDVYRVFSSNKRLSMSHVEPGLFVIVIPNAEAFEHYEVFT